MHDARSGWYDTKRMILKEDDTHFNLHKVFQHATIDFEAWDEKSEKDKMEAWKGTWTVVSGFFNLFG